MPNLPSAVKSIRKDKKRHIHNIALESELKTLTKKLSDLIGQNKADEARKLLPEVMSKLDKAAKKGIIKNRTADRKKSRLSYRLSSIKK